MGILANLRSAYSDLSFVGKAGLVLILLAGVLGVVYVLLPNPAPPATEAEARAKLQEVLDSWVARKRPQDLRPPRLELRDDLAFRMRLLRYKLGPQKSEERGVRTFPVTLALQLRESPAHLGASTVGLMGAPRGQGPLLAGSVLVPALKVTWEYRIARVQTADSGARWLIVGRKP